MAVSDTYLRKSTADQRRSVSRQERDWRTDCAANEYEPGRIFVDPELSASRYARKEREDWPQLVEHIRSGACQMLSLWEAARGARNMSEWVALLDLCREHGTLIRIFGGNDPATFDPRSWRDREALLREGINAEGESEQISRRSRDGGRDLALSGKPPGPLLFGYTRRYDERGKFAAQEIHPEQAAIVRQLAEDTLAGKSLNSQAQALNQAGIPSPKGGKWSGHGIGRLLQNPGYAPAEPGGDRAQRTYWGETVAAAAWPPILTYEQHRQLVRLLTTPGRRVSVDSTLLHYLSGAARCGKCGSPLRTVRNPRKRAVYIRNYACIAPGCRGVSTSIATLDRVVGEIICERLRQRDAAPIFAPTVDTPAVEAAQKELDDWQDHLESYRKLARAKKITAISFAEVEQAAAPEIEKLRRKIRELETPATLAKYADLDVPAVWEDLEPAVRREFVLALADVVLGPAPRRGSGSWTVWRLADSQWHGDQLTWGDRWRRDGLTPNDPTRV